jgi:hypothetical protein
VVENTGSNGSSVDWSMVLKNWLLASYAATLVSIAVELLVIDYYSFNFVLLLSVRREKPVLIGV